MAYNIRIRERDEPIVNPSELKDYLRNTEPHIMSPTRTSAAASSPKLAETYRVFTCCLLRILASSDSPIMLYISREGLCMLLINSCLIFNSWTVMWVANVLGSVTDEAWILSLVALAIARLLFS